ncbi:MAG: potassium transporter Kup [Candidatus Microthrix sp.]|nr:potassium transporter Kup [Candidatus Microthrix sp.]MBK7323310.1 potassium transporter Kup [Candidatus Microthrix sp.]
MPTASENHFVSDTAVRPSHPAGRVATLGALGVVFGDIGTSPLYSLRETFEGAGHAPPPINEANIIGVLSLVLWAVLLVVSLKYLTFVLKADNHGEGGILALTALIRPKNPRDASRQAVVLLILGLFGAALLYGDGIITPAISVLSAVEGTSVVTASMKPLVVPISIAILIGLFSVQRRGTAAVGRVFGPVMFVWFLVLGVLGITHIADQLAVLRAINPWYGVEFLINNGSRGFIALGSVVLVVTGVEALYADMGHFGVSPIRRAWYKIVLPGLVLNYFGQGAMLLAHPENIDNPFYRMAPRWALWPLVILATMATVIASQALISGAFSLTRQAVQLGYLPRVRITHTSDEAEGQIYIGVVNWLLLAACVALVLIFRNSGNLAAAYGIAVTSTMFITTVLFYRVARDRFGWSKWPTIGLTTVFLVVDLALLGANLPKIPEGGWIPIGIGLVLLLVLTTWFTGRALTAARLADRARPLSEFAEQLAEDPPLRGPGVGIYLGSNPDVVPQALSSQLRHARVLPENVCVLAVIIQSRPYVPEDERLTAVKRSSGVWQLKIHLGYSDDVDVPKELSRLGSELTGLDFSAASYVLGRETLRVTDRPGMAQWREHLFVFMLRNATTADAYFKLPPEQTIELGVQVEI